MTRVSGIRPQLTAFLDTYFCSINKLKVLTNVEESENPFSKIYSLGGANSQSEAKSSQSYKDIWNPVVQSVL